MPHTQPDKYVSFNHETLKILARAFDETWPFVAIRTHDYLSMVVRRERLANIVLDLGIKGERDLEKLKSCALQRLDEIEVVPGKMATRIRSPIPPGE